MSVVWKVVLKSVMKTEIYIAQSGKFLCNLSKMLNLFKVEPIDSRQSRKVVGSELKIQTPHHVTTVLTKYN